MKAFLNLEFENNHELSMFMERYLGPRTPPIDVIITPGVYSTIDAEIIGAAQETNSAEQNQAAPPKPARKPRSDAGQVRGPNKTTTGEPAASEPATVGGASAQTQTAAAPVTPTQSTPPAPTTPLAAPPSAAATTAPAGAGKKLTEADARAELKKISTEPGMGGTQAAIDYIKKFGVHQITKLPESTYEQFIAGVDKEIAAFRAKPKAPAAK